MHGNEATNLHSEKLADILVINVVSKQRFIIERRTRFCSLARRFLVFVQRQKTPPFGNSHHHHVRVQFCSFTSFAIHGEKDECHSTNALKSHAWKQYIQSNAGQPFHVKWPLHHWLLFSSVFLITFASKIFIVVR